MSLQDTERLARLTLKDKLSAFISIGLFSYLEEFFWPKGLLFHASLFYGVV